MDRDEEQQPGHITGIGGVFFRAKNRELLAGWYGTVLGLPVTDAATAQLGPTVWAAFDRETTYFGPSHPGYMINYQVDDLEAALQRIRADGREVAPEIDEDDYGRFAWAVDPEGNRFELWQPAPDG